MSDIAHSEIIKKSQVHFDTVEIPDSTEAQVVQDVKYKIDTTDHDGNKRSSSLEDATIAVDLNNFVEKTDDDALKINLNSDEPQETDRPILVKYSNELKKSVPSIKVRNKLLNLAIGEYFMRKNVNKAFYELTLDEIKNYTMRYENGLESVHKMKQQIQFLLEDNARENDEKIKRRNEALMKKNELKNDFLETIQSTAQFLETSGQPISEKAINRLFNRFQRTHNEMAKVRFEFLKFQFLLAQLQEKDEQLDDLGNGFKVFDFENMKTEMQTITSNIDNKNEDLEKMRIRYKTNVEQMQKFEESCHKINEELEKKLGILDGVKMEKDQLTEKLNNLRKIRDKLTNELAELNLRAQILTDNKIMLEYDRKEEELIQKKAKFQKKEEEYDKVFLKIKEFENKNNENSKMKNQDVEGGTRKDMKLECCVAMKSHSRGLENKL